jgi:hypothetical protein
MQLRTQNCILDQDSYAILVHYFTYRLSHLYEIAYALDNLHLQNLSMHESACCSLHKQHLKASQHINVMLQNLLVQIIRDASINLVE